VNSWYGHRRISRSRFVLHASARNLHGSLHSLVRHTTSLTLLSVSLLTTRSVTNGAHLAAIIGGVTAKYAGWRWCYWVPTIVLGATWLVNIFCLPETLYHRNPLTGASYEKTRSKAQLFNFRGVTVRRKPSLWDITHCFYMLKYPGVLLAGLYYSIAFGAGTVLFAVTGAAAFGSIYKFDTLQVGLAIGVSTTIGSVVGEIFSGPVSDKVLYFANKRKGGQAEPEARLHATWPGAFILPAGVIIEGVCLQYQTHWMGPVTGIAIGAFGLQIVSTTTFAYLTDCYKPQSAEISTLLNFGRLTFSFTLGFYMVNKTPLYRLLPPVLCTRANLCLTDSIRNGYYLWYRMGGNCHRHLRFVRWCGLADVEGRGMEEEVGQAKFRQRSVGLSVYTITPSLSGAGFVVFSLMYIRLHQSIFVAHYIRNKNSLLHAL
jgi:hypothetical protein